MSLETEVKFYIDNTNAMRERILELGATSQGRVFERNIRFEDSENSLIQKKCLLRLRKDARTRLTFKSPPPKTSDSSEFKIFKELEVTVSDFETMSQILQALNFHQEQVYEKWRETFILKNAELCLDTMPFGDFLEIEGAPEDICTLADDLNLKWSRRILKNYLSLFESLKQNFSLNFSDITFENFTQPSQCFSAFLKNFEAENL